MTSRLSAWWFPEAPARRLAAIRILTGGFVLKVLWEGYASFANIARTPVDRWSPVGPLRGMSEPLSPAAFDTWESVHFALGVAFLLGLFHRVLAPIYAASTVAFFAYRTSWGGVLHADNLFTIHIVALALTPSASAWSLDALLDRLRPTLARWTRWGGLPAVDWRFGWGLRLLGGVTTIAYLLAGVAKVVSDPANWPTGGSLADQIGNDALYKELVASGDGATELVPLLYQHPEWLVIPAVLTLIIEIGAPLALLDRRLGWVWAFSCWAMHKGIALVMGIVFPYPVSGIAYACFFPVDLWVEKLVALPARLRRGA